MPQITPAPTGVGSTPGARTVAEPWPAYIELEAAVLRDRLRESASKESGIPDSVWSGLLTNSFAQIYASRATFIQSTQNGFLILQIFYAGAACLLFSLIKQTQADTAIRVWMAILTCGMFWLPKQLTKPWREKVRAGYSLYVISIIHAGVVARALNVGAVGHGWIEGLINCGRARGLLAQARDIGVEDRSVTDIWTFHPTRCSTPSFGNEYTTLERFPEEYYALIRATSPADLDTPGKIEAVWSSRGWNLQKIYYGFIDLAVGLISLCGVLVTLGVLLQPWISSCLHPF